MKYLLKIFIFWEQETFILPSPSKNIISQWVAFDVFTNEMKGISSSLRL